MCTFAVPSDEAYSEGGIRKFIDNTERDNEVRSLKEIIVCIRVNSSFFELRIRDCNFKAKRVIIET